MLTSDQTSPHILHMFMMILTGSLSTSKVMTYCTDRRAGCTGSLPFTSVQLTTLGNSGANGPQSADGYVNSPPAPCQDLRTQLVKSGSIAISPAGSGVQRFTVPVTGTYLLNFNGNLPPTLLLRFRSLKHSFLGTTWNCHLAALVSHMWALKWTKVMLAARVGCAQHHHVG